MCTFATEMEVISQQRVIIRIGKGSLSFTRTNAADGERPIVFEPYIVKGGISLAANLREALKMPELVPDAIRRSRILLDVPSMLVPVEQFSEEEIETIFNHTFPPRQERRDILYNVLPNLKTVCLFAINKDLHRVITDRFDDVQVIQAMTPVWNHLHQRSFTGRRSKLYGYFHDKRLDIFSFQQNRFKFCNSFEASHTNDILYFLLYVWKQLHLDSQHDELHIVGDIPQQEQLLQELKRYLQKAYAINPAADFQQAPATQVKGMPYDLMTFIVKGR